jgi:hypothetical protein
MPEIKIVEKLDVPEGITRKTHFFVIRKDFSVVAIEKTKDMITKSIKTRKKNLAIKKLRDSKRQEIALGKAQRKEAREEIKNMRDDYKKNMERMRKEQRLQKELLQSKLAKARK